jgi:hypothetical protein
MKPFGVGVPLNRFICCQESGYLARTESASSPSERLGGFSVSRRCQLTSFGLAGFGWPLVSSCSVWRSLVTRKAWAGSEISTDRCSSGIFGCAVQRDQGSREARLSKRCFGRVKLPVFVWLQSREDCRIARQTLDTLVGQRRALASRNQATPPPLLRIITAVSYGNGEPSQTECWISAYVFRGEHGNLPPGARWQHVPYCASTSERQERPFGLPRLKGMPEFSRVEGPVLSTRRHLAGRQASRDDCETLVVTPRQPASHVECAATTSPGGLGHAQISPASLGRTPLVQ